MGDVADGEYLMRDGTTIKGGPGGADATVEDVQGETPITVTESPAKTFVVSHDDSALDADTYAYPQSVTTDDQGHIIDITEDPFLNGEGLVRGRGMPGRAITSLSGILCVPEQANKVYFCTSAGSGLLYYVDPITKELALLATYASKSPNNMIYSAHASSQKLYLNYTSTMSVDPTTGAIVTSGIAKTWTQGACIRTSDGVLYGANGTDLIRIDTTTDTAGSNITGFGFTITGTGRRCLDYCPINDSVYIANPTQFSRIACPATVAASAVSLAGLSGATGFGNCRYNAYSGMLFFSSQVCSNLVRVTPSADSQAAAYAFPPGFSGSGISGMVSGGRYLYCGATGASSPSEILIFDCLNMEWIGSLNSLNGGVTTGTTMDVVVGDVLEESFLYALIGSASGWGYFGGRL
jgi:hypothetical protein